MWTTGEEVKPRRPYGDFSKTNWGDHTENREGKDIVIRTTSNLITVISKLKDKQWEKILNAASAASRAKKETIAIVAQEPFDAPGPDFNLIDDDSDLMDEND
jgi:hypothetical protein